MKILVIGKQGQVATELMTQSEMTAHEVISMGRDTLDIRNPEQVRNQIVKVNPDMVINAAAYTEVARAEEESIEAYAVNRDGPRYLANACNSQGIPLIHISTDYVFDGAKKSAYVETDEVCPTGVYGNSKWEGEQAVRHGIDQHIILRASWIFSKYGQSFVKSTLMCGSERHELKVVDDQVGGPTSVKAMANVLLALCDQYEEKSNLEWGTYHYSNVSSISRSGFAETIIDLGRRHGLIDHDVSVFPIPTNHYPTPKKHPSNLRLSGSLFEKTFGISANDWYHDLNAQVRNIAVHGA